MKKKLLRGTLAVLSCLSVMVSSYVPVMADSSVGSVKEDIVNEVKVGQDTTQGQQSEYNLTEESGTQATNVYATLASNFSVVIPKTVILDGITGVGNYTVDVNGDISASESVKVVPDSSFTMSSVNKDSVSALVSQGKTEWMYSDMNENAEGTVTAEGLSAGSWSGSFNFNVYLSESQVSKEEATITLKEGISHSEYSTDKSMTYYPDGSFIDTSRFIVESNSTGAISVESSDKSVATVSDDALSGGYAIKARGAGFAIITVTQEADDNYAKTVLTINVTVSEHVHTYEYSKYSADQEYHYEWCSGCHVQTRNYGAHDTLGVNGSCSVCGYGN